MGSIRIKNGTPICGDSLCESCTYSMILKGYRETEELVFCNYSTLIRVPFKIYKCNVHTDKGMPTWEQMKDMAIDVKPISSAKPAGFYYADEDEHVAVPVETTTK